MTTRNWLSLFLLACALGACGVDATATVINYPPHPLVPRTPASVEMFSSGPPTRPHVDVALIEGSEQTDSSKSTAQLLEAMRKRAAQVGCDALVIGNRFARVDDLTTLLTGRTHDVQGLTATCIVYSAPALTATLPQPKP